jgi:hypothetical protein
MDSLKRNQDEVISPEISTSKRSNMDSSNSASNSEELIIYDTACTMSSTTVGPPNIHQVAVEHSITAFLSGDIAKNMFSALISAATAQFMSPLLAKMSKLENDNVELRRENLDLHKRVLALEELATVQDNTSRRNNIILSVPWTDSRQVNPTDQFLSFAKEKLGIEVPPCGILECFRLGKPPGSYAGAASLPPTQPGQSSSVQLSRPKSRPLVVKFVSFDMKRKIMSEIIKRRFGSQKPAIYVSDDLSPAKRHLLKEVRQLQKAGAIKDVWNSGEKIYIKLGDGQKKVISSIQEIENVLAIHN